MKVAFALIGLSIVGCVGGGGSTSGGASGTSSTSSTSSSGSGSGDVCSDVCTQLGQAGCPNPTTPEKCRADCAEAKQKATQGSCAAAFDTAVACVKNAPLSSWCGATGTGTADFDDTEVNTKCSVVAGKSHRYLKGSCD